MYSQLMVAACKAESKNEEVQDKVQARSAVTTKSVEGASELGNQIARLMAALTRAGQGNSPGSAPSGPRHRGHGGGRTDRTTSGCPNSHNSQTGLGQIASACSVSAGHRTETAGQSQGMPKDPKMVRVMLQTRKNLTHSSVSSFKVGTTWLRIVPPQPNH